MRDGYLPPLLFREHRRYPAEHGAVCDEDPANGCASCRGKHSRQQAIRNSIRDVHGCSFDEFLEVFMDGAKEKRAKDAVRDAARKVSRRHG